MIFLFFGSSLAHLEPKLQLFEVLEMMVRQFIITSIASHCASKTNLMSGFTLFGQGYEQVKLYIDMTFDKYHVCHEANSTSLYFTDAF